MDALTLSVKIPRQYVHDWPERTDCCPKCLGPDGLRPVDEVRGVRKVVSQYACPCGHVWVSTWLIDG